MNWLKMLAIAGMNGGGSGGSGGVSPEEVTTIVKEQFPGGVGYEEMVEMTVEDIGGELPDFHVFSAGDTVNIKVDGKEYSLVASSKMGTVFVGDSPSDVYSGTLAYGWSVFVVDNAVCFYGNQSHSYSYTCVKTVKIDSKYIQYDDDVVKYGSAGTVEFFDWDGNTDGLDSFIDNGCTFYKVSDFTVPYEHITSALAEVTEYGEMIIGRSSTQYGCMLGAYYAAIVTDAESNNIPSNGLYLRKGSDLNPDFMCKWVTIDTRREQTALYLRSPSGRYYTITVDDNGNLTAKKW